MDWLSSIEINFKKEGMSLTTAHPPLFPNWIPPPPFNIIWYHGVRVGGWITRLIHATARRKRARTSLRPSSLRDYTWTWIWKRMWTQIQTWIWTRSRTWTVWPLSASVGSNKMSVSFLHFSIILCVSTVAVPTGYKIIITRDVWDLLHRSTRARTHARDITIT
jgi:hypothetical protein